MPNFAQAMKNPNPRDYEKTGVEVHFMSMNDMLEAYLFEMHSLLEQLDDLVLAAEQAHTFSQDDVNEIFRIMHTIKGSSAMMEFNSLMTIAHRIEDLFYVIREKGMDNIAAEHKGDLFDLIFHSIDFFRAEIEKVEKNEPLNSSIDSFLDKINSFANKISGEDEGDGAEEEAPADGGEGVPAEIAAFGSAEFPYGLQVLFDEGVGMENLRAMMMVNSVRDFCEESQFDFYPPDVQLNPETANFIIDHGFFLRFRTAGMAASRSSAERKRRKKPWSMMKLAVSGLSCTSGG